MSYIGNQPLYAAFVTDQFSGNASTTVFTMSVAPANTASILVAVSGVLQDPSTYSVNGTTLTFSAAPPTGTGNISVRYMGIPASGVTTTAYRTVTEFTATAGQTTFSVPSYTVGYIDVYRNGVRLGSADFTATNGTTVVLAIGAYVGDLITTQSFYVSSVNNAIPAVIGAVTPSYLLQPFTQGTAQATTSGTSITFTGIPSWARRITVMINGVSTNGSSFLISQIGSGSITTSGYVGGYSRATTSSNSTASGLTFQTATGQGTGVLFVGILTWVNVSGNIWVGEGNTITTASDAATLSNVNNTLGGALDRIRITTVNGTDSFAAGSINIQYEG
jgi:hypothetical protein